MLIVYSKMDMEEIERWEVQVSPSIAMMELISRLPLHIENWFPEFVIVLKQNHYLEAVEELEPKFVSAGE